MNDAVDLSIMQKRSNFHCKSRYAGVKILRQTDYEMKECVSIKFTNRSFTPP